MEETIEEVGVSKRRVAPEFRYLILVQNCGNVAVALTAETNDGHGFAALEQPEQDIGVVSSNHALTFTESSKLSPELSGLGGVKKRLWLIDQDKFVRRCDNREEQADKRAHPIALVFYRR